MRIVPLFVSIILLGCSAGNEGASNAGGHDGNDGGRAPTGGGGASTADGGNGGQPMFAGGGGAGGDGGSPPINPCGTECGPVELCDGPNKGLDDDCDGEVDEGCPCGAGQASSCFRGDPSYRDDPGCNPGTMYCSELGTWGPCVGGNHATEGCFSQDPLGCHPINAVPFQTVDLSTGAGNFDDNADTHMYTVACPPGVNPCPVPNGTDYQPLQSGEYTVTYTKTVGGVPDSCTFPLYVGARGLRVELGWNYQGGSTIDLDLHLHKPMSTLGWNYSGAEQDCGFANCKSYNFEFGGSTVPHWFPDVNQAPDPVNWYLDPVFESNSCYFAPRGAGDDWIDIGMGCHNPRLDLDNVSCSPGVSDPSSFSFCAPENINVDFPPKDQWFRIGVHYYPGTSTYTGTVYPVVKVFCDGALAAELGPDGYFDPPAAFTFSSADKDKMWLVADVLFREDECVKECIVEPLYTVGQPGNLPVVLTKPQYNATVGPPYPPVPN